MAIQQRDVYWLAEVPPLDADDPGPHYCIVLDPSEACASDAYPGVNVVVVSSKAWTGDPRKDKNPDRVALRWGPGTGFVKECWAIPRWFFYIEKSKLHKPRAQISKRELWQIDQARKARVP